MALDGIVIANITSELSSKLSGGRIYKITQPEADELLLTVKSDAQYRLLISASASLPLIYLTDKNKLSPMTAPNFCMLLRKHIANGKILSITQPGLERIIEFEIEHRNELGDLCIKYLIIEIMGKHSNIIFCDDKRMILDSIKHVSAQMSSVREVLPGRDYFIPQTQHKKNPLDINESDFMDILCKPMPVSKAVYSSLTGISPLIAGEVCELASIAPDSPANVLSGAEALHLYKTFSYLMEDVRDCIFTPNIVYREDEPIEFSSIKLSHYKDLNPVEYDSISIVLDKYYSQRSAYTRMRQKSSDLRRIVQNAIERDSKKYDLQIKQLKDTEKRDKYKVYGELIHTYGYSVDEGATSFEALNYYTNENITIPLDAQLSVMENAQKYFDRYNKLKRTYEALTDRIVETQTDLEHLESIAAALDIATCEADLVPIKEELAEYGYIKKTHSKDKSRRQDKSQPLHYISSDGYDIYIGKNNFQNDELTFKFATGNDWWFHAKGRPGSHVIVKSNNEELPDRTFEEAGKLAAYYSKGRGNQKIDIDYTQKKNIKKPGGAKPGFVVYYTNYSLTIDSDISGIKEV